MTAKQIESQVRNFIFEQFLFDRNKGDLTNDVSFLETGIVDSTGILELLAFLEATYRISIQDEELVPDNLDSINNVVLFVTRKLTIPIKESWVTTHNSHIGNS